ncbi:MAG: glycosyltransferase family 2 protein [Sedimentisphaerales bacterium]|nr:glycosyltransferase family 2 protein [Sedimentisphaerales bacterium]
METLDVSILIVNWNTKDLLRDCLVSVYEQTRDISFEIIVIDNASSDGSAEMVKSEFPDVTLLENTKNLGFAAANNQGYHISSGRYVLLLNTDTVVLDEAIQKCVAFADEDPQIGVLGVRIEDSDGRMKRDCYQFCSVLNLMISLPGFHRMFPRSRFFGREHMTWWDFDDIREVDVIGGCYMLVRREAIEQVGLLDEGYFMYAEEMDWCWRFQNAKWKNVYNPHAHIIHYGGMSSAQNPGQMRVEYQKSILRFIEKRQGLLARIISRMLLFISGVLRMGYWTLKWTIGPSGKRPTSYDKLKQARSTAFLS